MASNSISLSKERAGLRTGLSKDMWFLTQFKRWGLLKEDPDYLAVAKQINRIELYRQAASQHNIDGWCSVRWKRSKGICELFQGSCRMQRIGLRPYVTVETIHSDPWC